MEDREPKDRIDPDKFKVSMIQARNGYILRTFLGQFVYRELKEACAALEKFYSPNE